MGKIVKGAKLVDQTYVVSVPEILCEPPAGPIEDDDRFANGGEDLGFGQSDEFYTNDALAEEPPEPQIDFEQLRADARALVDSATEEGEKILHDAATRAKEMVERATVRVTEIEAQARAQGHEEGVAAGRAAAEAQLAESVSALEEVVKGALAQRNGVIENAEPELVRLAMAIAERIVYDHVAIDPNVVLENVRHALTRLVGREVVTLRVNPADLAVIRQYRDSMASSNDVEHLRIVEDQRVDRGGVMIETDAGTIDAKISTQIREARRALESDDIRQAS
jgi:flagellar assembly protein FliH